MKPQTNPWTRNLGRLLCASGVAAVCGLTSAAWACGGGAPAPTQGTPVEDTPYSSNLRVLIKWSGELTDPASIVVAPSMNNVTGGFAWVVPVPSSVTPDDLFLLETAAMDVVDKWSGPREIASPCRYTEGQVVSACPELYGGGGDGVGGGGDGGGGDSSSGAEVSVTTTQLGAYELHFLSSDGADALLSWLDAEGLALPEAAAEHVGNYLDRDYSFVAIQVDADTEVPDGTELPALGFHLEDGLTTLPMLMSAAVAQTEQNVTIFTIADELGAIGLSNVTMVKPEYDRCMVPDGDIGSVYEEDLTLRHTEAGTAVWQQDFYYGKHPGWQERTPTTTVPLSPQDWEAIEQAFGDLPQNLSRIQLRYAPGELTVDPAFYPIVSAEYYERFFIAYDVNRTSDYPVCGIGLTEEGSCPEPILDESYCDDDTASSEDDAQSGAQHESKSSKAGCSTSGGWPGAAGWMLMLAAMSGGAGRRRS